MAPGSNGFARAAVPTPGLRGGGGSLPGEPQSHHFEGPVHAIADGLGISQTQYTGYVPGGQAIHHVEHHGRPVHRWHLRHRAVEQYDAQGRVVWKIEGNAGYVFRAQRILSLYSPGSGSPR